MKRRFDDSDRSSSDGPPFCRLFLIGNPGQFEDKSRLEQVFEKYGAVKDVWCLHDKENGRDRGLAYVQFTKTSHAAKAMDELDGKMFLDDGKSIKVKPAGNKGSYGGKDPDEDIRMLKLFVKIPTDWDEKKFKEEFEQYGQIDKVKVLVDHRTNTPKGLGFVTYYKAFDAATCYENCDRSHKVLFADIKRDRPARDEYMEVDRPEPRYRQPRRRDDDYFREPYPSHSRRSVRDEDPVFPFSASSSRTSIVSEGSFSGSGQTRLIVKIYGIVSNDMLSRLFGLIPGLEYCDLNCDEISCTGTAYVKYSTAQSAAYAKNKLDSFEYPYSSPMSVEYFDRYGESSSVADSQKVQEALKVLEAAGLPTRELTKPSRTDHNLGLDLPPEQPLLSLSSRCEERLFIVLERRLPETTLYNIFSRFGNLIEVFLLPGKNHGYAKYGSKASAEEAVHLLHRQEVCGCFMKVIIADPEKGPH